MAGSTTTLLLYVHSNGCLKRLLADMDAAWIRREINRLCEDLQRGVDVPVFSRVYVWSQSAIRPNWTSDPDWPYDLPCPMHEHVPDLVYKLRTCEVLVIQSDTGSGKSVTAPALAFKYVEEAVTGGYAGRFSEADGFKAIHVVASGVQAQQHADSVKDEYWRAAGLKIGNHSSALSKRGEGENDLVPDRTHYLYTTPFFAIYALSEDQKMHVVVIDDVHLLTPTMVKLLHIVKKKLISGHVLRVILLSATLSTWLKNTINRYFTTGNSEICVKFASPGRTPFNIREIAAGESRISHEAMCQSDGRWINRGRLRDEEGTIDTPNMKRLLNRAVQLFIEHCINNSQISTGVAIILPGSSDVIQAKVYIESALKGLNIDARIIIVTGQERTDIAALTQQTDFSIRVCITTPVLAIGSTLIGINTVIDSGVLKIPSRHCRQGVERLITVWQDAHSKRQRAGRVGRLSAGTVYQCYTRERADLMETLDHTDEYLQATYSSADLPFVLNELWSRHELMVPPDDNVFAELMLEAGTMGFFRVSSFNKYPRVDTIGVAISRAFQGLSLDLGLLLIYCAANRCLLPGLILVASIQAKHSGTKRPSSNPNLPGRDDADLPINAWPSVSGCPDDSDMVVYTDLLLNLFLLHHPQLHDLRVDLPSAHRSWSDKEGRHEFFIHAASLTAGLRALGLIDSRDELFEYERSGVFVVLRNGFAFAHLDEQHLRLFKACISMAFGHRFLVVAPSDRQRGHGHTTFECPNFIQKRKSLRVQGERMKISPDDSLAVYHNIFDHSPGEDFETTLFHQLSPAEFVLYGNVYGSTNDIVDSEKKTLTIHTNTGCILFRFEDKQELLLISRFRLMLKLQPAAHLLRSHSLVDHLREVIMDLPLESLKVVQFEDRQLAARVHTIDDYRYFCPRRRV